MSSSCGGSSLPKSGGGPGGEGGGKEEGRGYRFPDGQAAGIGPVKRGKPAGVGVKGGGSKINSASWTRWAVRGGP